MHAFSCKWPRFQLQAGGDNGGGALSLQLDSTLHLRSLGAGDAVGAGGAVGAGAPG
jgi:hypothetical protein